VAVADRPGLKLRRLLWAMAHARPPRCRLLVLDRAGDPSLLDQLNEYRSLLPWQLVRSGRGVQLDTLLSGDALVFLPASAVPVADALVRLAAEAPAAGTCLAPGPLCAYRMDDVGANAIDLLGDCPAVGSAVLSAARLDCGAVPRPSVARFLLYPPAPLAVPSPFDEFEVVAANG
jgi:hypothetical protein